MNQFQRLDARFAEAAQLSRSQAKKWIIEGRVRVNGVIVTKVSQSVNENSKIEWDSLQELPSVYHEDAPALTIIFENEAILVIDKAPFVKVHPSATKLEERTLIDSLRAHLGALWEEGMENPLRPGIIHRLDKDTSGLLLIAKNVKAHAYYAKFFEERKVLKEYYTLVKGTPHHPKATIEAPLRRDTKHRQSMMLHPQGKMAITEYEIVESLQGLSLLKVRIKTGRMHQIRVHMASIGHPVVGDVIYGDKTLNKKFAESYGLKRQFLHAFHLEIDDLKFEIGLEADLEEVLKALKKT